MPSSPKGRASDPVEIEITPELVASVRDAIVRGMKECDWECWISEEAHRNRTKFIDVECDLRLVAVRILETTNLFRDVRGLANMYIDEIKRLEDG